MNLNYIYSITIPFVNISWGTAVFTSVLYTAGYAIDKVQLNDYQEI